jgi:hypothetical protein
MPQPCPVHGTPHLDGYAVRTAGFLGGQVFDYAEAMPTRFPHANAVRFVSCAARNAGTKMKVKYCAECREALMAWCHDKRRLHDHSSPFVEAVVAHLSASRGA